VSLDHVADVVMLDQQDTLYQLELQQHITRLLLQLPERQRSALLLCYYQGLSNQEAATVLNLTVNALESLLARARRTLKPYHESSTF
jgi:RNA polymerase sigma-70 factor (ECF subfamily)